ncbi:MAG: DUF2798 domain-containing protein [Kurthia sp.]|nr:DUF2798 domain-containing protein [Candidatus Kurthia equi]
MQREARLPQNGKEGFLYGAIIVTLTASLMSTVNVIINSPSSASAGDIFIEVIKILPVFWVIAMALEAIVVGRIAEALTAKFTQQSDSFNAKIFFRIVFTVFGMSFLMTMIGDIYSNGFDGGLFERFQTAWPRNILIVFLAESLIIQPIARFAMKKMHAAQDRKAVAAK